MNPTEPALLELPIKSSWVLNTLENPLLMKKSFHWWAKALNVLNRLGQIKVNKIEVKIPFSLVESIRELNLLSFLFWFDPFTNNLFRERGGH